MANNWQSFPSPVLSLLYHDGLRKLSPCSRTARWTLNICGFILFSPSLAGQKTTCGQGLEGPWERPPPLDEPQRDGSSEDQLEDPELSGEA